MGWDLLEAKANKANKLSISEYTERYRQQLISKWNKTPENADRWVDETGKNGMIFFMLRFPDDPEAAADDDCMWAE